MVIDTLLLEASPGELRVALLAGGRLCQVEYEPHGEVAQQGLGAVICGRVRRLDPGMNAAFVDLGAGANGFMRARDALDGSGKRNRGGRISSLVQEGALVPVKVIGSARGDKGPTVSMAVLRDDWAELSQRCQTLAGPGLITAGPALANRLFAEYAKPGLARVVTNDLGIAKSLEAQQVAGQGAVEIVVEAPNSGLFEVFGVAGDLAAALERIVALPGGGSLTFDETEALSVVDLDSGSQGGRAGRGALDLNLAAVPEIARQLRLRNIGGVVILDALKLERAADSRRMLDALREAVDDDPAGVMVHGMTSLGMVELTRARRGIPLANRLLEPPGAVLKQAHGVACDVLRQFVHDLAITPRGATRLRVATEVAAVLRGPLAGALRSAAAQCGTQVALVAEGEWPRERVSIEEGVV